MSSPTLPFPSSRKLSARDEAENILFYKRKIHPMLLLAKIRISERNNIKLAWIFFTASESIFEIYLRDINKRARYLLFNPTNYRSREKKQKKFQQRTSIIFRGQVSVFCAVNKCYKHQDGVFYIVSLHCQRMWRARIYILLYRQVL